MLLSAVYQCEKNDADHQVDKFRVFGSVEKANEFLKQVESFCLEVDQEISKLESYSKLPKINFIEAIRIARSIKARSIWMGAHHVKSAVVFVIDACLGFQEERYSSAVISLRNDFNPSRFRLEDYVKPRQPLNRMRYSRGDPCYFRQYIYRCGKDEVDHQFNKFRVYQSVEKADEFFKQVESFCLEVDREISELESFSKLPKVNFLEATKIARSIKARSIWMGAKNVKRAAFFVIDACLGFEEESYSLSLIGLRNDFNCTRSKFETYMKMVLEFIEKKNKLEEQKQ